MTYLKTIISERFTGKEAQSSNPSNPSLSTTLPLREGKCPQTTDDARSLPSKEFPGNDGVHFPLTLVRRSGCEATDSQGASDHDVSPRQRFWVLS